MYWGSNLFKYGHMRMRQLLNRLFTTSQQCNQLQSIPLDMQSSNVGNISKKWLDEIYCSFTPVASDSSNTNNGNDNQNVISNSSVHPSVRIVFPTTQTMQYSPFGKENGWYFYWFDNDHYVTSLCLQL